MGIAFVTSSNTTAGGACTGSGIAPHRMDRVVGICVEEAMTRVTLEEANFTRRKCRKLPDALPRWAAIPALPTTRRACGWFDSVATRHATMVNGIDELAVT